jgi:hypothetical protein
MIKQVFLIIVLLIAFCTFLIFLRALWIDWRDEFWSDRPMKRQPPVKPIGKYFVVGKGWFGK